MKFALVSILALALSAAYVPTARATDGALQGTVNVSGLEVEVRLRKPDGEPAAGIPVRLLYARKRAVAVGRTDAEGRWSVTVARTGAYDAVVEGPAGSAETLRLSFLVLDTARPAPVPWGTVGAGGACLLGGLLLFFVRVRNRAPVRAGLLAAGVGLLGWSAWHYGHEAGRSAAAEERDVAGAARTYLRDRQVKPLSQPLERLLADTAEKPVPTQPHALLGQTAPDFELAEARGKRVRLSERLGRGPVVLVFYYGYYCNHCVGQLFALHEDIEKFRELGAEVLAVSADPPELTRLRFRQYGPFAFPVLADPGNKIGQVYGVYRPASGDAPEDLQHGTFVIGRDGRVHWAHYGYEPFTGNRTLLHELARLEGRLPAGKSQ